MSMSFSGSTPDLVFASDAAERRIVSPHLVLIIRTSCICTSCKKTFSKYPFLTQMLFNRNTPKFHTKSNNFICCHHRTPQIAEITIVKALNVVNIAKSNAIDENNFDLYNLCHTLETSRFSSMTTLQ